MSEPRILFVACTPLETRPSTGADQRMRILHDALASAGRVDFYQPEPPRQQRARRTRALGALRDEATGRAVVHPFPSLHNRFAHDRARFARVHPESYDVIFLHRIAASWWTGWTDARRTILDLDDVPSQIFADRMRRGMKLLALPRALLHPWVKRNERRILSRFRFNLVCSEEDRRYLAHPGTVVVQNAYWQPAGDTGATRDVEPHGMLFVGTLGYPPNAEGLAWFVEHVLPRIRGAVADATLTIVGRMPSDPARLAWARVPGVNLVGAVDEVAPFIRACKLEVCPLLRGQGTRVKVLESLAYAKSVVTTRIGAYGLDLGAEHGVIRRDDEESFAGACIELLAGDSGSHAAALAGQRRVRESYSPRAVREKVTMLVDQILTTQR